MTNQLGLRDLIFSPHLINELESLLTGESAETDFDLARMEFEQNGVLHDLDYLDKNHTCRMFLQRGQRHNMRLYDSKPQLTEAAISQLDGSLAEILRERERTQAAKGGVGRKSQDKHCAFCKNNGSPSSFYSSHTLKDSEGRVTCPVLFKYKCPLCGCTGANSHTIRYCPQNTSDTPSITCVTKSIRSSTGMRNKRRQVDKL